MSSESRDDYELVRDAMGDGPYALDSEGRYADVNGYLVSLTGYDRAGLLGAQPGLVRSEATSGGRSERSGDSIADLGGRSIEPTDGRDGGARLEIRGDDAPENEA